MRQVAGKSRQIFVEIVDVILMPEDIGHEVIFLIVKNVVGRDSQSLGPT